MHYINRQVPIARVASELDLRMAGLHHIHCWHPERHHHGDRTPSVGIRVANNTVKCFGCNSKPMGPIDLVMDVLQMPSPADAALWIACHFDVPTIPVRRHLTRGVLAPYRVGYEHGLDLLVRSGLWGTLSEAAQGVAPVLLEMADETTPGTRERALQMSYFAISRYSGVRSPNAVRRALLELEEIGFLNMPCSRMPRRPERRPSTYLITPVSDELQEAANAFAEQLRTEIAAEKELRRRRRQERIRLLRGVA